MAAPPTRFDDFILSVRQTVTDFDMIRPKDRVLVGVSGGSDSMALVQCLLRLTQEMAFGIGIAHLNHGLRPDDAQRDQAFVKSFSEKHRIEYHTQTADTHAYAAREKRSIEEAGRILRHDFLESVSQTHSYSKIALGHHRDDNAEQVLMNLLRGAGITGLSGIPPIREHGIIRPLIRQSKSDIRSFLDRIDQPFMEDASNQDTRFLRNKIRLQLIPLLRDAYNPEICNTLNRLSDVVRQEDEWANTLTEQIFESLDNLKVEPDQIRFGASPFIKLHDAVKRRIIRHAILKIKRNLKRITLAHVEDVIALAAGGVGGKSLDLPDRIRIFIDKGCLCFKKESVPLRQLNRK
ncbi:MAG: tRNA lysidine(34) synthetase TilS [Desulfobacteraceae bacterium]|nr:MAG: tRNA lysidine(34) synthetase TilS [Desulfobacteraceae bacterium]